MKAIMLMYDSLVRNLLEPYGCDWTITPNFKRLAEHSVCFDRCYVGSLPCMPARRELHTGRLNFFTRSWGPMEPYDDSLPERLQKSGVYTHLISDHYHYWEDGGATYHTRFSSWEIVRGQEGDRWKGQVKNPHIPNPVIARPTQRWRQDWVNRTYLDTEAKQPQTVTMDLALDFLQENHDSDRWLLQVECFDPHEPYYTQEAYKRLYPHTYNGPFFDWPPYRKISPEDPENGTEHLRCEYAALLSMCDRNLGRLLDFMDEHDLWKDTMLIVNTDHGFMLGEHGWWGKNVGPTYNEIANTPLFIWDPRCGKKGEYRTALVQSIDLVPTLYGYFEQQIPPSVLGHDLRRTIEDDCEVRKCAAYGSHGGNLNCTDGRYVYMLAPDPDQDCYNYTLVCQHMCQFFTSEEMADAQLVGPLGFTNGYPVLKVRKIKPKTQSGQLNLGNFLFDLKEDPAMNHPLDDSLVELQMKRHLVGVMTEHAIPQEVFERYGLDGVTTEKEG